MDPTGSGPARRMSHLAFGNTDSLLFESWNCDVRIWDLATQSLVHIIQPGDFVACMAAPLHDLCLAIACRGRTVVQGKSRLDTPESVGALAFIPGDDQRLLTGRDEGAGLRTWDVSPALQPAQPHSTFERTSNMASKDLDGPQVCATFVPMLNLLADRPGPRPVSNHLPFHIVGWSAGRFRFSA